MGLVGGWGEAPAQQVWWELLLSFWWTAAGPRVSVAVGGTSQAGAPWDLV